MESLRYSDWCYRSEGNCNVVIYSKKHGRVYRVLKVGTKYDANGTAVTNEDILAHYTKQIQYNACVMDRLYLDYMSVPVMKSINSQFLAMLAQDIESKRPDNRMSKSISLCPTVLDIPDYAFLPAPLRNSNISSFMFELKAGSVARSYNNILCEDLCRDDVPQCTSAGGYCFYCITKSFLHKHNNKRLSRYCPQELFSGNQSRMRKCIKQLLEDINCSRNKLRIFEDGTDITPTLHSAEDVEAYFASHLSKGTNSTILDTLTNLLISCLTHSRQSTKKSDFTLHCPTEKLNRQQPSYLPSGCVLEIFVNAQNFGCGNLEELQQAYKNLKSLIAVDPSIKTKLCIDGPYDTGLWRLGCRPTLPQGVSAEVMLDFIKVRNYLIYRTAKDASILITFQRGSNCSEDGAEAESSEHTFTITDSGKNQVFNCNVTIIDLDPKPFSQMDRYLSTEQKVYNDLHQRQSSAIGFVH